jgi:anti-anti-sigma factor
MSDDEAAFRGDVLQIGAEHDRRGATVTLAGEFDMAGSERFWAFISEALAASPRSVIVDASGLEFIDSSGLMAIVRARDVAAEAGVGFHVSRASLALRRVAEICGLDGLMSGPERESAAKDGSPPSVVLGLTGLPMARGIAW